MCFEYQGCLSKSLLYEYFHAFMEFANVSLFSKLFSDADTALRECDVEFVTKWRRYLQVKIKFYAAYARSFQGEYLLTLDKCGESIKTLREAQKRT